MSESVAEQPSRYATPEGRAFLRQQKSNNSAALTYLYYCQDLEDIEVQEPLRANHAVRTLLDFKAAEQAPSRDARTGKVNRPPRGVVLAGRIRAAEQERDLIDAQLRAAGEDPEEQQVSIAQLDSRLRMAEESVDNILDFMEGIKALTEPSSDAEGVA